MKRLMTIMLALTLAAVCAACLAESGHPAAGGSVFFGRCEQDGDAANGPEPIEWIVLEVDEEEGSALLIARYGLYARPYNELYCENTWQTAGLRVWLNGGFLTGAFTEEERAAILLTDVDNGREQGNAAYGTSGGNDTRDRVFLLSYAEALRFFAADEDRICRPTPAVVAQGGWADGDLWWLRSPGFLYRHAMAVDENGSFTAPAVDKDYILVRPAIRVSTDAGIF